MGDTFKELLSMDSKHLPDDVQVAFNSLLDELKDADWNLSPFSNGLRNFTGENFARIPQMVVSMFGSSPSLIDALDCAFQQDFGSLIPDEEGDSIVLKQFRRSVFHNYIEAQNALGSFSDSLHKSGYHNESTLLNWFSDVLKVLNNLDKQFSYHSLSKGVPPVMIPIHCELCHRFATESRFCYRHKHGSAERRKLELKFDNYFKYGRLFMSFDTGDMNAQLRRVGVWNDLSLDYLSKMEVYPAVGSQLIFSFDWLRGLPDTFSVLSENISGRISEFGKVLDDGSELWHQLDYGVTVMGLASTEIMVSALFRHQLFCEVRKFDRRSKNRKADPAEVLRLYDNGNGLKKAEIARRLNLTPPAISKIIKKHLCHNSATLK